MPVKRRLAPPTQPSAEVAPSIPVSSASPLLTVEETLAYLKCSHHEVRQLERAGVIKPVPYFDGHIKPRRYLRADVDKHIAKQIGKVA